MTDEDVQIARVIGDVWLSALVGWVTGRNSAAETGQQIEVAVRLPCATDAGSASRRRRDDVSSRSAFTDVDVRLRARASRPPGRRTPLRAPGLGCTPPPVRDGRVYRIRPMGDGRLLVLTACSGACGQRGLETRVRRTTRWLVTGGASDARHDGVVPADAKDALATTCKALGTR